MDRATNVVARDATSRLHIIPFSGTIFSNHSRSEGHRRGGACGGGASAVPAGGTITFRSRAAPGIRPAGIMTGLRLCRWTGTGGGGQHPSFSHVPGSASGAERRRWFACRERRCGTPGGERSPPGAAPRPKTGANGNIRSRGVVIPCASAGVPRPSLCFRWCPFVARSPG